MTLKLVKVENGVGEGDVLCHKFVYKTPQESADLKKIVSHYMAYECEMYTLTDCLINVMCRFNLRSN